MNRIHDYRNLPIIALKDGQFAIGVSKAAKRYYAASVQPTKKAAERLAQVWTIESCYDAMLECSDKIGEPWADVVC